MENFFQAVALVLVAVILALALQKQGKEMAMLLSLLVCCMVAVMALGFLKPVVDFINKLQSVIALDDAMLRTLLKVVGIAITAEIASLICVDAGSGAMGKALSFLASCVILWLSLPMLTALLELVERILDNI